MIIAVSNRLRIEKVTTEDGSFFFTLMNSPQWIRFIGDRNITSEEVARVYIQQHVIDSYEKNGYGLYKMILVTSEEPIGLCGFIKRDYLDYADVGFAILPKYEGKGYTFEALEAVMKYGKETLKLNPMLAITTEDNARSRYLLNKIGLSAKGRIKPPGKEEELILFSDEDGSQE